MNVQVKQGYKLTEVGVIPDDWNVSTVGSAFNISNQLRLPISSALREKISGSYPYYGPTGVQGWINEFRVNGTYALIGEDGDHFLKWATQSMTLLVSGKFNVNNHAHLIGASSNNLVEWFYWFFSNRDLTQYLTRQGASRYKLTKAALIDLPCVLPPKREQEAIVSALSEIDALISGLDQLIAKKRDIKQAAMQQLLTGQQRLPGFSGEWEVKRLGDEASFLKGKGLPKSELAPYGADPCIHYGELFTLYPETIREVISRTTGSREAFRSIANDVLMPTSDVTPRGLAKASCITVDGVILGGDILVIRSDSRQINGSFLSYVIRSHEDQVLQLVTGSTVFHLYGSDMKKFTFSIPPVLEQTAIVNILDDMEDELIKLESRRQKTNELKQGMTQELLTGRTRLL